MFLGHGEGVWGEVPRIFHDIGEEGGPRRKYDIGGGESWFVRGGVRGGEI